MLIPTIRGQLRNVNISKYSIDWEKRSASKAQFNTKLFLKDYWLGDRVCEEFLIPGSKLRVDFINFSRKIALEVSGAQHERFVKFFHKNKMGLVNSLKRDMKKLNWIENEMGFKFLEIYDHEVKLLSPEFFLKTFEIEI